jgi:hypothetical protein
MTIADTGLGLTLISGSTIFFPYFHEFPGAGNQAPPSDV